ncbi:MAG: helix-turn-helix transcriptional regulator [Candidatus Omnitrophota bacterium]|nr:MAG: helix-turn-helix transcriptional regulator [Candidatus Omnitrophota bacterium]
MSELRRKIGDNIRYYRSEKKLTQAQLAKKAKLSRGYISRVEHGRVNMYLTTLFELAKALGVSCKDLVR